MLMKKFAAMAICCIVASVSVAQETKVETTAAANDATAVAAKAVTPDAPQRVKVMLNKDGSLEGTALLNESKKAIADTKVTLTAEGKVVDSVQADENGTFAFANVAPGAYQVLGSADGFVGSSAYDVVSYGGDLGGCSSCSVGMASAPSEVVYDSYASQPVSSFSSCNACSPCGNTCGGGLGGGRLGGGLGSRLGGGLLSNGRVGLLGLVGLAGLGGDDSSPDR